MAEEDEDFKIKAPGWFRNSIVAVGKWGPDWFILAIVVWFGLGFMNRQIDNQEENARVMRDMYEKLLEKVDTQDKAMQEHIAASLRTQLYIQVMCAGQQEDTKACWSEYYAQQKKEKALNRVK